MYLRQHALWLISSRGQFLWENDHQAGSGSLTHPLTSPANLRIINISILLFIQLFQLYKVIFQFLAHGKVVSIKPIVCAQSNFSLHEIDWCAKDYPLLGSPAEILQTEEADSRKTIVNAMQTNI